MGDHCGAGTRQSIWCRVWTATLRDLLTALQTFPRDAELLAFEDGSEDYCEREVDDHLGASEMAAP
jgi:hypothetical protein